MTSEVDAEFRLLLICWTLSGAAMLVNSTGRIFQEMGANFTNMFILP
jgi:hypothetical protein